MGNRASMWNNMDRINGSISIFLKEQNVTNFNRTSLFKDKFLHTIFFFLTFIVPHFDENKSISTKCSYKQTIHYYKNLGGEGVNNPSYPTSSTPISRLLTYIGGRNELTQHITQRGAGQILISN